MIRAGFEDIPILSVAAAGTLVDQPGFKPSWLTKIKLMFVTVMFADCLAKMYYAIAPREKLKGAALTLRLHYMNQAGPPIAAGDCTKMFRLLEQAIGDFQFGFGG